MKKKLKLAEGGGVSIDYIYPTYEEFRKSMGEVGQFLFNAAGGCLFSIVFTSLGSLIPAKPMDI